MDSLSDFAQAKKMRGSSKIKMKKNGIQWFDKKEAARSMFPYLLTFWSLKHFPKFFVNFIAWCASFFYFIFDRRARCEAIRYQKILKECSPNLKIRPLKQLASFAISLGEKIDCWTNSENPIPFENIHLHNDDVYDLISNLNEKRGAFIFISHLGNFEILRSLAAAHKMGVQNEVALTVISDKEISSNFSKVLQKIAPQFFENTVSINEITPATMEKFMDTISRGGLVVCAGDRLSKNASGKIVSQDFLGKSAPFSYGAFLLALLLDAPVYFMFGFKEKNLFFSRKFEMYVKKARTEISSSRKKRDECIKNLCAEYARTLEDFCKMYPYQWYNFFDFWAFPLEKNIGEKNGK